MRRILLKHLRTFKDNFREILESNRNIQTFITLQKQNVTNTTTYWDYLNIVINLRP